MQSPSTGTGKLLKKSRNLQIMTVLLIVRPRKGFSRSLPLIAPQEKLQLSETPTNASATSTPATSEPAIDKSSVNCADTVEAVDFSGTDDLLTSAIHIRIEGDETVDDMSLMTHRA